jgi:hypothetical protein
MVCNRGWKEEVKNMYIKQLHIGDGQNSALPRSEQNLGKLEDAVLQYLPSLCGRLYRDAAAQSQRIVDCRFDLP